jgi:signal recognition particle subunit SRP54
MISSMTKAEKADPDLLAQSPSRRRRVAKGSGFNEKDVSKLVQDFTKMRSMMQNMGRGMPGMGMPGMPGMGMPGMGGYPEQGRRKKPKKKKKGFGSL